MALPLLVAGLILLARQRGVGNVLAAEAGARQAEAAAPRSPARSA
jgi:hypothetical protein